MLSLSVQRILARIKGDRAAFTPLVRNLLAVICGRALVGCCELHLAMGNLYTCVIGVAALSIGVVALAFYCYDVIMSDHKK